MHIALVRTVFDHSHGGAERYAVNLARQFVELGHRVSVICQRCNPDDARDMKVVHVSRPKVLGPWRHRWFAERAGKAARETGADVVLCLARAWPGDVLRLGDGLHRAWLGARYPNPASRRRAMLNPRHLELTRLEQALFTPGRFSRFIANSEMIRRAIVHMYGVPPGRIRVIPNGVDPERFSLTARERRDAVREAHGIPRDAPLLLFSGMDFRRKGLDAAAEAFAATGRDDLWFACVGRGDASDARKRLEAAGAAGRAVFAAETDDIAGWYGAADVLVLPTMHDPSANAVTEALACGTPVVTSPENGARQHIRPGVNGMLARRDDAATIAAACAELLESRPDPEAVAQAGGLTTTRENTQAVLGVLEDALAERQAPPPRPETRELVLQDLTPDALREFAAWLGRMQHGQAGVTQHDADEGVFRVGDIAAERLRPEVERDEEVIRALVAAVKEHAPRAVGRASLQRALRDWAWERGQAINVRDLWRIME